MRAGSPPTAPTRCGGTDQTGTQTAAGHACIFIAVDHCTAECLDSIDARLIARLLYERDSFGMLRGFIGGSNRVSDGLRLLVRNRMDLVELHNRCRSQLSMIEDALFPELKEFFFESTTKPAARLLLENWPTPAEVAEAPDVQIHEIVVRRGRYGRFAAGIGEFKQVAAQSAGLREGVQHVVRAQKWLLGQLRALDSQLQQIDLAIAEASDIWPEDQRLASPAFQVRRAGGKQS